MPYVRVKGGHGGRIDVKAGQILEIINVQGKQVCDFFAFSRANIREHLSPAHTRSLLRKVFLEPGDKLVTVLRRPMFILVEDTAGVNDFSVPPCDPEYYQQVFGVSNHRNCRQNLAEIMADHEIPYEYLPDPFNFFQPTPIQPNGRYGLSTCPAKPSDKIVLQALMDVIAAASACPQDLTPLNDGNPTDIDLVVREG